MPIYGNIESLWCQKNNYYKHRRIVVNRYPLNPGSHKMPEQLLYQFQSIMHIAYRPWERKQSISSQDHVLANVVHLWRLSIKYLAQTASTSRGTRLCRKLALKRYKPLENMHKRISILIRLCLAVQYSSLVLNNIKANLVNLPNLSTERQK